MVWLRLIILVDFIVKKNTGKTTAIKKIVEKPSRENLTGKRPSEEKTVGKSHISRLLSMVQ